MLDFLWLTIRQAKEALKHGRPEEAQRLLGQPAAQGHKRALELLQQAGQAFLERGRKHLSQENYEQAWNDLLAAEQVGSTGEDGAQLRRALTKRGLTEARGLLEKGEPGRAGEMLHRLRSRMVQQPELDNFEEAARFWMMAREQAGRGEFAQALQTWERVAAHLAGNVPMLASFRSGLEEKNRVYSDLLVSLHEAASRKEWRDVVRISEKLLAIAPQHLEARKARARAWQAVEPKSVAAAPRVAERPAVVESGSGNRFLLWIDGVGGFLVCLKNQVVLGQATGDATVDIPILADMSRVHANLTRESEGYLLEAVRPVLVNGKSFQRGVLQSGDRVTLGSSCQMLFRQPVPVSASARLDLVSGHRLPVAVDAVLLMAETLVLGPGEQSHVIVPGLEKPVILYRQREGIAVRYSGNMRVDGQCVRDRSSLAPGAVVSGDDFAFALEPVGTGLVRA